MTSEESSHLIRAAEKPLQHSQEIKNSWLLRDCHDYYQEYKNCASVKGKIHSYYVRGEFPNCSVWKANFQDCKAWASDRDVDAAKRICVREEQRVKERLLDHYNNDVWEHRNEPPENWNKELPKHLEADHHSLLRTYQDGTASGKSQLNVTTRYVGAIASTSIPNCVIL